MNSVADTATHIVILGAGPYGLSLAAHLREQRVPFRIFGRPMEPWAAQMPEGMTLHTIGAACNLSTGGKPWTLEDFCHETGRPYHPEALPVAVEDFAAYGCEFARRYVPTLEHREALAVLPVAGGGFRVQLDSGEALLTSEVVVAVGMSPFPFTPEILRDLPAAMSSHTVEHRSFDQFRGRDVTVVGGGASALTAAALLHEAGARCTLLSRRRMPLLRKTTTDAKHGLLKRLHRRYSPLGPGVRTGPATRHPLLFHSLPCVARRALARQQIRPAAASALCARVVGKLPTLLGWRIADAELLSALDPAERRINLALVSDDDVVREHVTSHVLCGTGFRVDLNRLRFLPQTLLQTLRIEPGGSPALNRNFQASVEGLYFVGPVAEESFGPLLRFAAGAHFASCRLAAHLARNSARRGRQTVSRVESNRVRERHAA